MWFICGLGNPGKKFEKTRHNVGFELLDAIVNKNNIRIKKKNQSCNIFEGVIDNNKCIFCKPLTYMNDSGSIIRKLTNFYKIEKNKIIIIHDDLDLILGKVKIKSGGGNGGHKGLASIDQCINNNYIRIRLGIDHPGSKELVSKFVLNKFNKVERKTMDKIINFLSSNFNLFFKNKELLLTKLSIEIQK